MELPERLKPVLDELERRDLVGLARDEKGEPVAVIALDIEKLRADVARRRKENDG